MKEPTNGELKIMMDNLNEKFTEKITDVASVLKEVRDDVKDVKNQNQRTIAKLDSHEVWIRALKWALGIIVTIAIAGVPVLRYVQIQDIRTISKGEFEAVLNERCGTPCVTQQK